jgi:hypothetical protein
MESPPALKSRTGTQEMRDSREKNIPTKKKKKTKETWFLEKDGNHSGQSRLSEKKTKRSKEASCLRQEVFDVVS